MNTSVPADFDILMGSVPSAAGSRPAGGNSSSNGPGADMFGASFGTSSGKTYNITLRVQFKTEMG